MNPVYLDNAASTRMDSRVLDAMMPYLRESYGNPLSLHPLGQEALRAVDRARGQVAALIGAAAEEVMFTGSGTEADNFALKGVAESYRKKGMHIVTSGVEHHAVMNPLMFLERHGWEVTRVGVDSLGLVDPADVEKALREDTVLVSVILGNNEVGTIQPVREIASIAKDRGILVHTDAACSVGNIPVDVNELGVDLLSISAHKFYGPKGVGALYLRRGTRITQLIHGGIQEFGRRAGADNVPGIVGLGAAAEIAAAEMPGDAARIAGLRDRMVRGILERVDHVLYNGHPEQRLPGNINLAFEFVEGEALLLYLVQEGLYASSGSTCTSKALKASHVLNALGIPPQTCQGSLQISLGRDTTEEDVARVVDAVPRVVEKLRAMSPLYSQAKK